MKTENKVKNTAFITYMQIIGCFLVIMGHSFPLQNEIPDFAYNFRAFIYAFHMPVFVWCSGYLMTITKQADRYDFLTYTKNRVLRIMVPYVVISAVGFLPKFLLSSILNDGISLTKNEILEVLFNPRASVWGHFWFLPMIFVFGLLGYGILKLAKISKKPIYVYAICTMVSAIGIFVGKTSDWFALNDIIHYFFYFALGIACGEVKTELNKSQLSVIGVLSFAVSVVLFVIRNENDLVLKFIVSLLMMMSVYCLSNLLSSWKEIDRKSLVAQTYSIFIISWPCQLVVEILLEKILNQSFYVIFPCMFAIGIVAPLIIIKLIDLIEKKINIKILSALIGR